MADVVAAARQRVSEWFDRARDAGWLEERDLAALQRIEQATPAELFAPAAQRPLVVAFFGGTGVGKSSLLNRLAGEAIAQVGVQRPTSQEITLYVHADVELADLPPGLPRERVRVARHHHAQWREVLWIDTPDIDSTALEHRALVLAWLPHIDLLVYVVSPERYRDDVGWKLLHERGHRHGWIFVMNRADEGDPRQTEDLRDLLGADFPDPLVLQTCCAGATCEARVDQFPLLEASIGELLASHGLQALQQRARQARLDELRRALLGGARHLGDAGRWQQVERAWAHHWQAAHDAVLESLTWSVRSASAELALRASASRGWLKRLRAGGAAPPGDSSTTTSAAALRHGAENLWDELAQTRLTDALDALEVETRRAGLGSTPLRSGLEAVTARASLVVTRCAQDALQRALARPGNRLQRAVHRGTGFLMKLLPALALLGVSVELALAYRRAVAGEAEFLGVNFAIHSALLVLSAWLLPYLLHRWARPSIEEAARRGMERGLRAGLQEMGEAYAGALAEARAERELLLEDAGALARELAAPTAAPPAAGAAVTRLLTRAASGGGNPAD